ncbi:MAG: hypothetical protein HZB40_11485 [Rhodocyclales bacterium]|nr:hypothetical protein [Rhodocyclales bacterium]
MNVRVLLLAFSFALAAFQASAHGGEDHVHANDAKAGPAPVVAVAPRAVAWTDDFELVAVLEDKTLTLMLDRYATNEPVVDAKVEVDGGAVKAVARQIAPGVYVIPATSIAAPGKYPLAISVEAGELADLLTLTLDLAAPATGVQHAHSAREWLLWGVAAALLLAAAGLVLLRWRRQHGKAQGL